MILFCFSPSNRFLYRCIASSWATTQVLTIVKWHGLLTWRSLSTAYKMCTVDKDLRVETSWHLSIIRSCVVAHQFAICISSTQLLMPPLQHCLLFETVLAILNRFKNRFACPCERRVWAPTALSVLTPMHSCGGVCRCWLPTEHGVIAAFIVPMLVMILVS